MSEGFSTSACNKVQDPNHGIPNPDFGNLSKISEHPPLCDLNEGPEENKDDEDEDVDFNPFLIENNSVEPSSSLSSEVEDLDTDVADSREKSYTAFDRDSVEIQTTFSPKTASATTVYKESVVITPSENGVICDKDAEGAICMRTRARYSLASFTLDELETFLQESDDEDDLQNVDEEEEYRKFLAGVLRGDESQNLIGNSNVDEEDEENDADFELELEEALESEPEEVEVRPVTRRKKHQKSSLERSKKLSGNSNRPLKPLIPYTAIRSFPAYDRNHSMPNMGTSYVAPVNNGTTSGFTPHQIGQLHCLIHEHVQLLIQVFSLSVLEPGKSSIAAEVKELVLEMLKKREQALTWRKVPHPSFCFIPPYVQSSVSDGLQRMLPSKDSNGNVQRDISTASNGGPHADTVSLSSDRNMHLHDDQASYFQMPWVPYVCGPKLSVVDVAPLRLVESFINDVSSAVRVYERRQIELGFESGCQKEPLFSLHNSPCSAGSDDQGEMENNPPDSNGGLSSSSSSSKQMTKKTKAANLLEKAKNQPVASVPMDIAKLAQRFVPFFNPSLYPHKLPPAAIANHFLFTDSEDELLALGLMEYNTDWKAIQQRFLPCKSKHQIFVRQKNRVSSKAPENPIKAVRRMKNSPLTSEEVSRIEMGIKMFSFDWVSIWRSFVPYRDPSLLARQWRIAHGTQKSYACDANKNAKRRLNAQRRRTSKTSSSTRHSSSEKEGDITDSGDNHIDKEEEAYVHEAFLADFRPGDDNVSSIPACMPTHAGSTSTQSPILSKYPHLSSFQAIPRPYRSRKQYSTRLVKLAPGLPPVNLPPSVRVMSQSAFKDSQAEPSLINSSVKSGQTHSDLQMHPLLFQAPHDGLPPYSPAYGNTTTPSSFALFPGKQPQLNLSRFRNPSHIGDGANVLSKRKNASSPFGSDFHPLLQRTDDVDTYSVGATPTLIQTTSPDCISSASDKTDNELDLDIRLSNKKAAGNKRTRKASDDTCDYSLQEIVMEQEELSDSEEEFGEDVEFECEEMADSEGESMYDSDDARVPKAQNDSRGNIKTNTSAFNLNFFPPISPLPNPENAVAGCEFGQFGADGMFGQNQQLPGSSKRNASPDRI